MGYAEEMYAKFESDGEETVRNDLAAGIYVENDAALAREWLRRKAQGRIEAFQASQSKTAERAADAAVLAASAAERAADAAREHARLAKAANTMAKIAIVIAAMSLISSIVIPFLR